MTQKHYDNGFQNLSLKADCYSRRTDNTTLYNLPVQRLGSVSELADQHRHNVRTVSAFLYGKRRNVAAYDQLVMLKNIKQRARVVWI
jgi:hypothetical protein